MDFTNVVASSPPHPDEVGYPQRAQVSRWGHGGMGRQSDLPVAPADMKFSLAVAIPTSAFPQGLTTLGPCAKSPRARSALTLCLAGAG